MKFGCLAHADGRAGENLQGHCGYEHCGKWFPHTEAIGQCTGKRNACDGQRRNKKRKASDTADVKADRILRSRGVHGELQRLGSPEKSRWIFHGAAYGEHYQLDAAETICIACTTQDTRAGGTLQATLSLARVLPHWMLLPDQRCSTTLQGLPCCGGNPFSASNA